MKKVFDSAVDFQAHQSAEDWLKSQGYSVGRMQGDAPIGIKKGAYDIQKWRNLSQKNIRELDGTMYGDMRTGPVTVELKESPA